MSQPHMLLIDINAIGYAAMYQPALSRLAHNGEPTGAMVGALMSIRSAMERHADSAPIVLWDGSAAWRKSMLPAYKENRSDDPKKVEIKENYQRQTPVIRQLLLDLGIPQVSCPDSEADDLAGFLCRHIEDWRFTLLTHDHDWLQAVDGRVTWESTRGASHRVGPDDFETLKDGPFSSADEYLECKIISGDSSDGIDGVPGVGLKTARKHLQAFGGLDALCEAVERQDKAAKGAKIQSIAAHRERIERNRILMDWKQSPPLSPHASLVRQPASGATDIMERYHLKRLQDAHASMNPDTADRPLHRACRSVEAALFRAGMPRD